MQKLTFEFLEKLEYSWTAEVQLKNDQFVNIWCAGLPMSKNIIKKVLCVSSDLPKCKISRY